jgi:hypothetical membrane protein
MSGGHLARRGEKVAVHGAELYSEGIMVRQILLLCGILSPLLYALADALAGMLWGNYSFRDQTISELGAIGAPSRVLFSILLIPVYLLLVAFGVGVWQSAAGRRRIRVVAGLLIGFGVLALTVGQFVPMRPRGTEQGLTGALHLVEGMVAMLMILAAMGFAATALDKRFRVYTLATIALMFVFGAWSGMEAPQIEAGLATPWLGVKERIWWYAYQLWFSVLAFSLLRQRTGERELR